MSDPHQQPENKAQLEKTAQKDRTQQIVHHAVRNYQLTSRSRQFWRLKTGNEAKIVRSIRKKNQQHQLAALAQKQQYYSEKLHELLDRAAEENDPRLIDNVDEAEWYLRKHVITDTEKMKQIAFQVWKQRSFCQEFRRDKIEPGTTPVGLAKLQQVNVQAASRRQAAFDELLLKYAEKQASLAHECEESLKELQVPFFVGPSSQEQKQHVLDFLYKSVESTKG